MDRDIFSNREWKAARKMWQVDVEVKARRARIKLDRVRPTPVSEK